MYNHFLECCEHCDGESCNEGVKHVLFAVSAHKMILVQSSHEIKLVCLG